MCDLNTVKALFAAAGVSIGLAIGAIAIAAGLNNSFWGAGGAPVPMGFAAGFAAAAAGTLGAANVLVANYFQCMGAPADCLGHLSNLQNALDGLILVLGVQAVASGVAAATAWIPWAGAAPMYVILGVLIVQAAIIPSVIVFANDLIACAEQAAHTASSALPLVTTVGIELIIAGLLVYLPKLLRRRRIAVLSGHKHV